MLAPHFSALSIGKYRALFEEAVPAGVRDAVRRALGSRSGVRRRSWRNAVALRWTTATAHVVFTAHSLPARIRADGDPYEDELMETSRLIAGAQR